MKNYPGLAEKIFAIFSIFYFSGAVGGLMLPGFVLTLMRYFIWFTAFLLICLRLGTALRTALRDLFVWMIVTLAFISFLWADIPIIVLKDNRDLLQMASFALYFATRFNIKQQVQFVAWGYGLGICASTIMALAVPSVSIHQVVHSGAWKGVYGYKNNLGSMMVLSSFTFALLPAGTNNLIRWGGVGLSIALMLLSTSKTALVLTILLGLILTFYRNFRWQGKVSVLLLDLLILVLGGVGTLVIGNWVALLTGLGRDPTLTGRTLIWGTAITKLWDRPFLGYGRGGFWYPGSPHAIEVGRIATPGFVAPHGHNGFLDLALDLGLIGFALFIISFVIAYGRALRQAYKANDPTDVWPLAFLMFLFMNNVTESYLLYKSNIYWTLYMVTTLSVMRRQPFTEVTTPREQGKVLS